MNDLFNEDIDFVGAKVALICKDSILTILRDDIPTIPFPDMWDLPGGCREGKESAFECLRRETFEELGINILPSNIEKWKYFEDIVLHTKKSVFAIGNIDEIEIEKIKFGDEGQEYRLMKLEEFFENSKVIPEFKERVKEFL